MKHSHILHTVVGATIALAAVSTVLLVLRSKNRSKDAEENSKGCLCTDCEMFPCEDKYAEVDAPEGEPPAG